MKQTIGALAVLGLAGVAVAEPLGAGVASGLTLDVSSTLLTVVQEPEKAGGKEAAPATHEKSLFGEAVKEKDRTWFLTVGAGVAADGDDGTHGDLFVACSTFIGTGLEIQFEASGWYFDQETDNTAGGGFAINLRWHALHGAYGGGEGNDWTVYVDAGLGVIVSGDDVPPGGSSVNLAPRAGVGATFRLGESSTRLVTGLRWHHMSNARTNGDTENPDFNAPMLYIGVEWPM